MRKMSVILSCLWLTLGWVSMLHTQESKAEIIWAERLFDRSKGLTEEHVYQVFEDRRGYFWITTDTGRI